MGSNRDVVVQTEASGAVPAGSWQGTVSGVLPHVGCRMALALDKRGNLKVREAEILDAVIETLHAYRWIAIRIHTGLLKSPDGMRYINLAGRGNKGRPDLLAVQPGRTLFIETKTREGQLSIEQAAWREYLVSLGYEYLLARAVRDVEAYLNGRP